MQEVAAKAGVSIGTVSRVVHGQLNVHHDLRRRVEEAMRELNYHSDHRSQNGRGQPKAGQPKAGQTRIVAFLLITPGDLNPVYAHILHGIEEQCSKNGFYFLFSSYRQPLDGAGGKPPLPNLLQARGMADCVAIAGSVRSSLLETLSEQGLRYVVLANDVLEAPLNRKPVNQVRYDDLGGADSATRYLIQLGHKHIWFIGDSSDPWLNSRLAGYERAMHAAGLEPKAQTVALSDDPFENGQAAISLLLDHGANVTAVLAGSDEMAYGVREGFRQHGREIPRNASLIGFEHHRSGARQPNLTSVCLDMVEVGRQLGRMAMARTEASSGAPDLPEVVVPTTLIRRSSCHPYRDEPAMIL
jgi:DNA-binding LacI/PurR family transcriptional regulator